MINHSKFQTPARRMIVGCQRNVFRRSAGTLTRRRLRLLIRRRRWRRLTRRLAWSAWILQSLDLHPVLRLLQFLLELEIQQLLLDLVHSIHHVAVHPYHLHGIVLASGLRDRRSLVVVLVATSGYHSTPSSGNQRDDCGHQDLQRIPKYLQRIP